MVSTYKDPMAMRLDGGSSTVFNVVCTFSDPNDKDIKFSITTQDKLSRIFDIMIEMMPHRKDFKSVITNNKGKQLTKGEKSNEDVYAELFLSESIDDYEQKKNDVKLFDVLLKVTFSEKKNMNVQLFLSKVDDKIKSGIESSIGKVANSLTSPFNITYNSSYSKVSKEENDILVIVVDDSFVDEVIKNEAQSANAIFILSKSAKANAYKKSHASVVKNCAENASILISARFFAVK